MLHLFYINVACSFGNNLQTHKHFKIITSVTDCTCKAINHKHQTRRDRAQSKQTSDMHTVSVHNEPYALISSVKSLFQLTWKVNGHYQWDTLLQYLNKLERLRNKQMRYCFPAVRVSCILVKPVISVFQVLQGNAEAIIRWGTKVYHLSVAYFLWNMPARNC